MILIQLLIRWSWSWSWWKGKWPFHVPAINFQLFNAKKWLIFKHIDSLKWIESNGNLLNHMQRFVWKLLSCFLSTQLSIKGYLSLDLVRIQTSKRINLSLWISNFLKAMAWVSENMFPIKVRLFFTRPNARLTCKCLTPNWVHKTFLHVSSFNYLISLSVGK